jgi:carotenoid cleavage dioxygenase
MASPTDPPNPPLRDIELDVCGTLPAGLSGRLVAIGSDDVVHSVHVRAGRASYRNRHLLTRSLLNDLVAFGGSVLTFGDDSPVYQLSADLAVLREVDLAGRRRIVTGRPQHDPTTGDLHLLAREVDGGHSHVVVSAGALTRHSRPVLAAPRPIRDLVLGGDHCVLIADGRVGVAARDGEARTTWITTDVPAAHPVLAHEAAGSVIVFVLTPFLERWVLCPAVGSVERTVLDETPRNFADTLRSGTDTVPRWMWTTGGQTIGRHDLVESHHAHHNVESGVPGDFVVVADARHRDHAGGGAWLVVFVHESSSPGTELRVIDAADITAPPVATVRIPRPTPPGLRCTWLPSIHP